VAGEAETWDRESAHQADLTIENKKRAVLANPNAGRFLLLARESDFTESKQRRAPRNPRETSGRTKVAQKKQSFSINPKQHEHQA